MINLKITTTHKNQEAISGKAVMQHLRKKKNLQEEKQTQNNRLVKLCIIIFHSDKNIIGVWYTRVILIKINLNP